MKNITLREFNFLRRESRDEKEDEPSSTAKNERGAKFRHDCEKCATQRPKPCPKNINNFIFERVPKLRPNVSDRSLYLNLRLKGNLKTFEKSFYIPNLFDFLKSMNR